MAGDQQDKRDRQDEAVNAADSEHGEAGSSNAGINNEEYAGNEESSEVAMRIQEAVSAALAEQRDMVLRAQAEVQNMRRRCEVDVEKAHKFGLEKFGTELLTVVDNLERTLDAVPDTDSPQLKSLVEGVELTLKGFLETFAKFNIQLVNPVGEPFDPQVHQAITTIVNPDVEPNSVVEVMQKGYTLHGRVLRPAMVVVARGA